MKKQKNLKEREKTYAKDSSNLARAWDTIWGYPVGSKETMQQHLHSSYLYWLIRGLVWIVPKRLLLVIEMRKFIRLA